MLKQKIALFALLLLSFFLVWCNQNTTNNILQDESAILYEICNDLSLPCKDVYNTSVVWYGEWDPQEYNWKTVDIVGGREISDNITKYLKNNNRQLNKYNIADGTSASLVWYEKENIHCAILSSLELDEEFLQIGDGEINIGCFKD